MKKILIISLIISLISIGSVNAKYYDTKPFEYLSPRQLGMGGAGVAVLDEGETVYTNPAGIIDSGNHLNVPIVIPLLGFYVAGAGDDTFTSYAEFRKAEEDGSSSALTDLVPKSFSLGASTFYGYSGESFGQYIFIGGYNRLWGAASLLNPVSPRIEYNYQLDTAFGVGYAEKLMDEYLVFKDIKGGLYLKHLNRQSSWDLAEDDEYPSITIADVINEDVTFETYDASGYGLDIGFMGTVDSGMGPIQTGLVFNNIFGYLEGHTFQASGDDSGVYDDIHIKVPTTAKAGIALKPFYVRPDDPSRIEADKQNALNKKNKEATLAKLKKDATLKEKLAKGARKLAEEAKALAWKAVEKVEKAEKWAKANEHDAKAKKAEGEHRQAKNALKREQDQKVQQVNAETFFSNTLFAVDYDIIYPTDSYIKRLHMGVEQTIFDDWLKLQMGLNQGYGTMGLMIDSLYNLGLTYYTEEWGAEVGQDPHSFWLLTSGFEF